MLLRIPNHNFFKTASKLPSGHLRHQGRESARQPAVGRRRSGRRFWSFDSQRRIACFPISGRTSDGMGFLPECGAVLPTPTTTNERGCGSFGATHESSQPSSHRAGLNIHSILSAQHMARAGMIPKKEDDVIISDWTLRTFCPVLGQRSRRKTARMWYTSTKLPLNSPDSGHGVEQDIVIFSIKRVCGV